MRNLAKHLYRANTHISRVNPRFCLGVSTLRGQAISTNHWPNEFQTKCLFASSLAFIFHLPKSQQNEFYITVRERPSRVHRLWIKCAICNLAFVYRIHFLKRLVTSGRDTKFLSFFLVFWITFLPRKPDENDARASKKKTPATKTDHELMRIALRLIVFA